VNTTIASNKWIINKKGRQKGSMIRNETWVLKYSRRSSVPEEQRSLTSQHVVEVGRWCIVRCYVMEPYVSSWTEENRGRPKPNASNKNVQISNESHQEVGGTTLQADRITERTRNGTVITLSPEFDRWPFEQRLWRQNWLGPLTFA
jgi:hypothetical protein